jgi:hypothetical protein
MAAMLLETKEVIMDNIVNISRILVIRNDTTSKWEASTYILDKGELGIGWFSFVDENGNNRSKPIVKTGNGKDLWNSLPQNDYILTEN